MVSLPRRGLERGGLALLSWMVLPALAVSFWALGCLACPTKNPRERKTYREVG